MLTGKKQSAQTWNNKVAHMRALYNFWIAQEYINLSQNPFHKCNVQRDIKKKKTLTRNQLTRLYLIMQQAEQAEKKSSHRRDNAMLPAWYWLTVLDMFRYTGLRLNQLLHIRVKDVFPEEGYINLMLEGSKTHREWQVPAVRELRMRLTRLLDEARKLEFSPSDPLFDAGRIMRRSTRPGTRKERKQKVRSFFRRLSKESQFTVSPHRFRHTLATELMKAPERNLQMVKELLGHRSVNTTMEYVALEMSIVGKTLENELALFTDRNSRY